MADSVQEIKGKLSIVDVVGSYVKLTKAGKYHKGLCPFHSEKTPSFMVSPDRDFYHCFGCGKGGDIFSFVQDIENLDFKGALRLLAQKAGVTLEYDGGAQSDAKEKLFLVLREAKNFFVTSLQNNSGAQAYLKERGISKETLERFEVGYAPNEWRSLSEMLLEKEHAPEVLLDAGLTKKPEVSDDGKKPYDRFRGRIMFPIRDVSGRTVGFSGRIFEDDPKHPQAKYLNSPETAVFHKSNILYGLDMAKEGIRKYGFAMLVEGQVDLIMAHQAGFTNTVALSGTSFTEAHARLLKRHTDNLLIAFDGDSAGVAAAGRAALLALPSGLNTKLAKLPEGLDPADVLQKDPTAFKQSVKEAEHVVDFFLWHVRQQGLPARDFKLTASRTTLPFVAAIPNAIDREHFIARIARALEVSEEAVAQELQKGMKKTSTQNTQDKNQKESGAGSDPFLSRTDTMERLLVGMLFVFEEKKDEAHHAKVHDTLIETIGTEKVADLTKNQDEKRAAIIEADLYLSEYEDERALDAMLTELAADFKKEHARSEYKTLTSKLKSIENSGSKEEVDGLVKHISELAKKI